MTLPATGHVCNATAVLAAEQPLSAAALQALQKHPDKNRDNSNAAAEFAELQKAYDLLSDDEARKALDDLLK